MQNEEELTRKVMVDVQTKPGEQQLQRHRGQQEHEMFALEASKTGAARPVRDYCTSAGENLRGLTRRQWRCGREEATDWKTYLGRRTGSTHWLTSYEG